MIDKLAITMKEMDLKALRASFGETTSLASVNRLYGYCESIRAMDGKHLFTVYYEPYKANMNPFKLEFNPSKLGLKYIEILKKLDSALDIKEASIQRIDHAADFDINVVDAFESVRMKHKRNVKTFGDYQAGRLTGFMNGSKNEIFTVYDKAFEQKSLTFRPTSFKRVKSFSQDLIMTRFELRQKFKKVPFKSVKDLPFLASYNPFKDIEVYNLKAGSKEDIGDFMRQNKLHGLQNMYQQFNKYNNFKRDYAKYFESSNLPEQLRDIYRANLGHFFDGC